MKIEINSQDNIIDLILSEDDFSAGMHIDELEKYENSLRDMILCRIKDLDITVSYFTDITEYMGGFILSAHY